jgi:hypothetical protein
MERIEPARIADILADSPIWARLALTAANPSLVERAADTMAALIVARLGEPEPPTNDARQMALPIR